MWNRAPFKNFSGTVDECFSEFNRYDVWHNRHFYRYPLIIRVDDLLPEPLEVGCSTCGIKMIALEESGMCRVCDFSDGFEVYRSLHSLVYAGDSKRPLIISRCYEKANQRSPPRRYFPDSGYEGN